MLTVKNSFKIKSVRNESWPKYFSKKSNVQSPEYQFMQRSKLPMMHFQKSLPRLPIPVLKKSCERYLAAQRPLLIEESFRHVESQANSFASGVGLELDKQLRKKDKQNKHTSYISKIWFETYLSDRIPLPINYNPLIIFNKNTKIEGNNQLLAAANFTVSSLRFMLSLRDGILEPEVFHLNPKKSDTDAFRRVTGFLPSSLSWYGAYAYKAFPLDMSQYTGLFGSSRIPEMGMDRIVNDPKSKHILVQRRGHFYSFEILDKDGNLITPSQIVSRLKYVLNDQRPPAEYPVGILTTQDRDVWASQRHQLSHTGNERIMKLIDTAVFNLILDDEVLGDDKYKTMRNYLHGDGSNRWFDKSFSLMVSGDGVGGVNFEHSWGDGVAVLRYFQDVYKETTTTPLIDASTPANEEGLDGIVQRLDFNLDEKLKENITMAKKTYNEWCSSLGLDYLIYDGLGKQSCKNLKVSPDSIMQLGFQAAHHLLKGKYVGTYESCSTAAFKHGRTETMRPCTMETKTFCDSLHSASPPHVSDLASMIRKCSVKHGELTKDAAMGQGFDRHFFALKKIAEHKGIPLPGIFGDMEYKMLNTSILSTSTLSSPAVMAGGFGPVVSNGLGIGYSVMDNALGAVVTSYPSHYNGAEFVEALQKSYEDIHKILEASSGKNY